MKIGHILEEMRAAAKTDGVKLQICKLAKNGNAVEHWDHDGPEVWIQWIESEVKGAGAVAMRKLVEVADRHNVMLRAMLDDDGRGKLAGYYAQFGFQIDPAGGDIIERPPVPLAEVSAFRNWFEGSKVVDQAGNPLVVYHGTHADFKEFSLDHFGKTDGGWAGKAFYFTERPHEAAWYAKGEGGNIRPVYLLAKRPMHWVLGTPSGSDIARHKRKFGAEGFVEWVKSQGYDSIRMVDVKGWEDQWVVFSPDQIRSAISEGVTCAPAQADEPEEFEYERERA
jgi:hypothetical protein